MSGPSTGRDGLELKWKTGNKVLGVGRWVGGLVVVLRWQDWRGEGRSPVVPGRESVLIKYKSLPPPLVVVGYGSSRVRYGVLRLSAGQNVSGSHKRRKTTLYTHPYVCECGQCVSGGVCVCTCVPVFPPLQGPSDEGD